MATSVEMAIVGPEMPADSLNLGEGWTLEYSLGKTVDEPFFFNFYFEFCQSQESGKPHFARCSFWRTRSYPFKINLKTNIYEVCSLMKWNVLKKMPRTTTGQFSILVHNYLEQNKFEYL